MKNPKGVWYRPFLRMYLVSLSLEESYIFILECILMAELVKEVRVDDSLGELMRLFELSLKRHTFEFSKDTQFDSYYIFLGSGFSEQMEGAETLMLDLSAFFFGLKHTYLGINRTLLIFALFMTLY